MSWSQRQEVVDVPGIITIIYILLNPDGRFHPSKYSPPKIQRLSSTEMLVRYFRNTPLTLALCLHTETHTCARTQADRQITNTQGGSLPKRNTAHSKIHDVYIDPVDPKKVQIIKKVGQGTQGVAYSASYQGLKLCAKFLSESLSDTRACIR